MNGNFQPQQWKPTPEEEKFARHLEAAYGEDLPAGIGHRYLTVCQLGKKWNPKIRGSRPGGGEKFGNVPVSPHSLGAD